MLAFLPAILIAPAAAEGPIHPALQAIRGRKIWMVGAPVSECERVERELGLVVECDPTWATTEDEVVIWCTEIPHEVGPAILQYLGRTTADVRTHQTNPVAAGTGECGKLFEITVRYPNGGAAQPAGSLADGSTASKKLFGSSGHFAGKPPPDAASTHPALVAIRGRKIWMVNAPVSECERVERELGLVVECDPTWEALAHEEIVIWCTEIAHGAAPAILEFLGKPGFLVRTHQTNPSAGGTGECGAIFEITVRY